MTKLPTGLLGFMFATTGATVLAVGYGFLRTWPLGTVVACVVLLAALGRWYAVARRGDDRVALRTVQGLTLTVVVVVLVVRPLLKIALGLS